MEFLDTRLEDESRRKTARQLRKQILGKVKVVGRAKTTRTYHQ